MRKEKELKHCKICGKVLMNRTYVKCPNCHALTKLGMIKLDTGRWIYRTERVAG
jgi:phage FluMu protein Com